MPHNKIHHQKFNKAFPWALTGSLIYEGLKALHYFFLLRLLPPEIFGTMGSLYALIYLTTYISDLGATNSIPQFFSAATKNKQSLKKFLLTYSLLPHLPFIVLCAAGVTYFIPSKFSYHPILITPFMLILLETIRPFLRRLLHTAFKAKYIVLTELTTFALFLALIWIPYILLNTTISLNLLFTVHLIDSATTILIFIFLVLKLYFSLPNAPTSNMQSTKIISSRLFNYLLRISKNFFTSNFLTPLFAIKFGLAPAGLFYFASTIATSLQSIVKSAIGYPGSALLASLKESPQAAKKDAFSLLCQKLCKLVAPIIIFLSINYKAIIRLSRAHNVTGYTTSLFLLFLLISLTELFFILYEQFYIIEEAVSKLFFFKLLELAMLYGVIKSPLIISPILTLLGLIVVRFISFLIIATNAFYTWKIKPFFKTTYTHFIASIIISITFSIGLSFFIRFYPLN